MAQETFACPECQATLRYSPNLKAGVLVQCPKCRTQFPVPDSTAPPTDPAYGPSEEYTASSGSPRPRFSETSPHEVSPTRRPAGFGGRRDEPDDDYPPPPLSGEYSIDVNRWLSYAGQHYSAFLGPAIGFMLLAALLSAFPYAVVAGAAGFAAVLVGRQSPVIAVAVSQLIEQVGMLVLMAVVMLPLWSGLTAVCLAQLKGRAWTFGDFFSGFQRFGALAGVGLAAQLVNLVVVGLPSMLFTVAVIQSRNFQLMPVTSAASLPGLVIVVFCQVRLFLFAPALIFDRNLSAVDAMKANWDLTRGHF